MVVLVEGVTIGDGSRAAGVRMRQDRCKVLF